MNYPTLEDLLIYEDDIRSILKFSNIESTPRAQNFKLSKQSLKKLNKFVANCQNQVDYYLCGLFFLVFCFQCDIKNASDDLVSVTTSNLLFVTLEQIKGSRLSAKLLPYLVQMLDTISLRNKSQESTLIDTLVKNNNNFCFSKILSDEESFKNLANLAKNDKIKAFNEYYNLINTCHTLEEQLIIFSQKSTLFFGNLVFEDPNNPTYQSIDFLYGLAKFLDAILFQTNFELDISKKLLKDEDENMFGSFEEAKDEKEKITIEYKYDLSADLVKQDTSFNNAFNPLINFLIENILIRIDVKNSLDSNKTQEKKSETLRIMVSILTKMYFNPSFEKEKIMEKIMMVFKELDESLNFFEDAKTEGAKFLNKLLKNKECAKVEQFSKFTSIYNKLKLPGNPLYLSVTMSKLSIKNGFPLNLIIEAGATFEQIIEIWRPNSILHLAFATKWYDINFQIDYLGGFDEKNPKEIVLLKCDKMSFEKSAYRLTLLLKKTGLYRIMFDNKHSWLTEKQLRYRIFVLQAEKIPEKYAFPFHDLTRNQENFRSTSQVEKKKKQSKYFLSAFRAVMLLDQEGLHFMANQPDKCYEITIEKGELSLPKFKEGVIKVLQEAFSENLVEFFTNRLLSFSFVQNHKMIKINENDKEGKEELELIPTFYSILDEQQIILKESVIDGKEILINLIKKSIKYNKTMVCDNIMIMYSYNDELNIRLLNDLKINFADLVYGSINNAIVTFKQAYKREENKDIIAFICLLNALISFGIEKVKKVMINEPEIFVGDYMKKGIPHEIVFTQALKEMELENLENLYKKIDFTYINVSLKVEDLIIL